MTTAIPASQKYLDELATIRKMQKLLLDRSVLRSCLNCESWWAGAHDPSAPGASQKPPCCTRFDALPPPNVIFYGCDEWEMIIPF